MTIRITDPIHYLNAACFFFFTRVELVQKADASSVCSMTLFMAPVSFALLVAAACAASQAESAPFAWAYLSCAVWAIWLVSKGWSELHFWERVHLVWGAGSAVALCKFTQATALTGDPFEVTMPALNSPLPSTPTRDTRVSSIGRESCRIDSCVS